MSVEHVRRKRITAFGFRTVSGDEVDFLTAVDAAYEPLATTARRSAIDNDDIAAADGPLALDAEQP